jgi:hypothetical protein
VSLQLRSVFDALLKVSVSFTYFVFDYSHPNRVFQYLSKQMTWLQHSSHANNEAQMLKAFNKYANDGIDV